MARRNTNIYRSFVSIIALTAILVVALALTGCGSPAAQVVEKEVIKEVPVEVIKEIEVVKTETVTKEVEKEVEKVVDNTKRQLILYSGRSESLVAPIIELFEAETGITVKTKFAKSGVIAATILEEGDNTFADVFYSQDPGSLGLVQDKLQALPSSTFDGFDEWTYPSDKSWAGITGRTRNVVYNTDAVDPNDLPDDMWGYHDSSYKGKIGWAPTNSSFQTMVLAMINEWGESKTAEWLSGIQANDPLVYPKNTPIVAAAAAGEVEVGFVNHYYLHRFIAEEGLGFKARGYHPRAGGPGALVMVSGVGILNSARNVSEAQEFISFLQKESSQEWFVENTYEYPLTAGVDPDSNARPWSEIEVTIDRPDQLGDLGRAVALLQQEGILP
jgi:iron(III) transport system substrate-binding protein